MKNPIRRLFAVVAGTLALALVAMVGIAHGDGAEVGSDAGIVDRDTSSERPDAVAVVVLARPARDAGWSFRDGHDGTGCGGATTA